MKTNRTIAGWLLLLALATLNPQRSTAFAQSAFVTFSVDMATNIADGSFIPGSDSIEAHGTFNGWGALTLVQKGSSTVFTNTAHDTADANGGQLQYKFVIDGSNWENPATGQNRCALLPATNGASLVLPTTFFNDAGAPVTSSVTFQVDVTEQIALGNFIPGTSYVEARGWFNNWAGGVNELTNTPNVLRTNQYGYASTNVWVGTFSVAGSPGGADDFKYVIQNQNGEVWDSPSPVNQDGNGNRFFANVSQTLPIVYFSDQSAQITFNVDMSAVVKTYTNFNPASVTLNGDFNGWGGGVPMTNNPAPNTNIYTAVIISGMGSSINYQFRYNELDTGNIVYDRFYGVNGGDQNRSFLAPNVTSTNLPAVLFNDATVSDYLMKPVPVFFSVDMNGAVGTDGWAFDPGTDEVYINGQFVTWYPWGNGNDYYFYDPVAGYQMIQQGASTIYTNTIIVPAGTLVAFEYKYGMAPYAQYYAQSGYYFGPLDDEAPLGQNHYRVVRSTAIRPYPMPVDKFGYQYAEPFFNTHSTGGGHLNVGKPVSGRVPVAWLGRPGAHLQVRTNLASGTWQELVATDGTNWTSGYSSTNGFVSQTNWPAVGTAFFRLVKP